MWCARMLDAAVEGAQITPDDVALAVSDARDERGGGRADTLLRSASRARGSAADRRATRASSRHRSQDR